MEGYVGGTEIQLGIQPLAVVEKPRLTYDDVVKELISANNVTRLYGIKGGDYTSWLYNGGLLYYDLKHPEYATPECKSLDDLVAYEFAGRRIVENLLGLVTKPLRSKGMAQYSVFAGNSDYRLGPSNPSRRVPNVWAYHENYAAVNPASEVAGILPFLTTRHLFAGAGFILPEHLAKVFGVDFLIAQRACAVSLNEGKLYVGQYSALVGPNRQNNKVLHVTVGDANVSDYATRLKIGSTVLVHQLLEAGWEPPGRFLGASQSEHVANTWVTCAGQWEHCSFGGRTVSAIDVQRVYFDAAKRFFGRDQDTNWVLVQWGKTLDGLEKDPMSCTQLDWVLKKWYLETRRGKLSRDELVRFALCYHAADPDKSTFRLLAEHFGVANQVSQQQIKKAIDYPPGNTRAAARAIGVGAIAHAMEALGGGRVPEIGWSYISYLGQRLDIPEPDKTYMDIAGIFARSVESHLPTSKERR